MKRLMLLLALVLFTGNCQSDCHPIKGTWVHECESYRGSQDATQPYSEEGDLSYGRNYILARNWLHNPTDDATTADISCEFWLSDWHAGDNGVTDIEVCPHSSRLAEIQWGVEVWEGQTPDATCIVIWH